MCLNYILLLLYKPNVSYCTIFLWFGFSLTFLDVLTSLALLPVVFSWYILIVKRVITIITIGFYVVLLGETKGLKMRRGVSSGGGQSSLGYLFGNGEPANSVQASQKSNGSSEPVSSTSQSTGKQTAVGVPGHLTNNYYRADGQNCGNFITVRLLVSLVLAWNVLCCWLVIHKYSDLPLSYI